MSARSGDEQRAQRGENDGNVIDLVERSRHHVEGEQEKVHLTSGASEEASSFQLQLRFDAHEQAMRDR